MAEYKEFQKRFKLLAAKNPQFIVNTLSNIFSMRIIGNKTHGDLAEIGISEFINQFMYDYESKHVGKDLFRAKSNEEDIVITNEISKKSIPLSLKAYGDGPLQLSTDKKSGMFKMLELHDDDLITDKAEIDLILSSPEFDALGKIHVMPLIYNEKKKKCNIMVFDAEKAQKNVKKIEKKTLGSGRKHPVYLFLDENDTYICEVRYGGASANALQRGLWTHTKRAYDYFDSLTNGWINYEHNLTLVRLFSLALVATEDGHSASNVVLKQDIDNFKSK